MNTDLAGILKSTGVKSVEFASVIIIKCKAGKGTTENPNRNITQFWSMEGELLAAFDPLRDDPNLSSGQSVP